MSAARAAGRRTRQRPIIDSASQSRRGRASGTRRRSSYLAESERPWASLLLVMPLVILYGLYTVGALGSRASAPGSTQVQQITAFTLIEELFSVFGVAGRHLPAFALVALLLSAHLIRKDPWRLNLDTLLRMAAEAVGWAAPLFVLGWAVARFLPLEPSALHANLLLLSVGAGLYEELLFRLLAITVLSFILRDLLLLPGRWSGTISLVSSALLFSLYHYLSPTEVFAWRPFVFRTLAGGYLGLLYLLRGFGITAFCHTAYDLAVVGFFAW